MDRLVGSFRWPQLVRSLESINNVMHVWIGGGWIPRMTCWSSGHRGECSTCVGDADCPHTRYHGNACTTEARVSSISTGTHQRIRKTVLSSWSWWAGVCAGCWTRTNDRTVLELSVFTWRAYAFNHVAPMTDSTPPILTGIACAGCNPYE